MFTEVKLTPEQQTMMQIARVGFMNACPFFCYYFYAEMKEYPTKDIPSAATDGRRVFYNPDYLETLKPSERVFILAHEVYHVVSRHPARMNHYRSEGGFRGLPWCNELFNVCADFIINAGLVAENIGTINPAWLLDPDVKQDELVEDVYEKYINKNPSPPPQPQAGGQGSGPGRQPPTQPIQGLPNAGQAAAKNGQKALGKPDRHAQANGGAFDQVLPPQIDPATGKQDIPDESEFREAIARAAGAAKAMGKLPGAFQRMVDEILEPQISWREHVRMLVTGRLGSRHETWNRPNRRRLVLDPIVIMPGRRGFGANTVACAIDTSGSTIDERVQSAFFAEVGGVLADVRPKRVVLIWCDSIIQRVDEAASLDELALIRTQGAPGGGGTSFIPPFEWLKNNGITPDTMIYLTDMMGTFPEEPSYPTIWCSTIKNAKAPFGDIVEIIV